MNVQPHLLPEGIYENLLLDAFIQQDSACAIICMC